MSARFGEKGLKSGHFLLLSMMVAIGTIQGCASNPEQENAGAESTVVAATQDAGAEQASAKAEEVTTKAEKDADEMMASLAKKDKYALVEAEPAAEQKAEAKVKQAPVEKKQIEKVAPKKVDNAVKQEAKVAVVAPVVAPEPAPEPAPKVEVAKVEKPAPKTQPERKKLVKKALDAGLKDLPITLDMWSLRKNANDGHLQVSTPTWQMGEGSYLSQIWLTADKSGLFVHSSSDIDPNAKGSGVELNGGERVPFTRIESGNVAVLEGDWMEKLSDGGTLEIFLGFFPGKTPPSPTFKSDASLDALTRLVPTYQQLVN